MLYEIICSGGRNKNDCPIYKQDYCCVNCGYARYLRRERKLEKEETKEEIKEESKEENDK